MKPEVHKMPLADIEDEIESVYKWWHTNKRGVTPKEVNRFGDLWRRADYLIWKAGESA